MVTTQFDQGEKKRNVEQVIGRSNIIDCYKNFVSIFEIKVNFREQTCLYKNRKTQLDTAWTKEVIFSTLKRLR